MKYINKILSLFVIALIATSCDPDAERQLHPNSGS